LRRVATLVAHEASQSTVLEAIAVEAGSSFAPPAIQLVRYERDRSATVLARCGAEPSVGAGRWTPRARVCLPRCSKPADRPDRANH